jgi:hypothetical protein
MMPTPAAEAITLVIASYESGVWQWGQKGDGLCVAMAILRAHRVLGTNPPTLTYLAEAMRERFRLEKHPGKTFLGVRGNPIAYNDAKGRTLEDILMVLRKAMELADK